MALDQRYFIKIAMRFTKLNLMTSRNYILHYTQYIRKHHHIRATRVLGRACKTCSVTVGNGLLIYFEAL